MDYEEYTADDFLLDDSFLAYCRGSDPGATTFWQQWQQRRPANLSAFREAERRFTRLNAGKPRLDDSLRQLDALIDGQSAKVMPMPQPVRSFAHRWWAVAASVLFGLAVGYAGYQRWNPEIRHETAYGQQRTVRLPDGSVVVLNSHSVLSYRRRDVADDGRTVELTGEAHFMVRHLPTHAPFRVRTPGAFDVQVLGTEFTLSQRPALSRVVLRSGRVRVAFHTDAPARTLQPGDLVEVVGPADTIRQRRVRPESYSAWRQGQFVFENVSLTEAVRRIEDQFGVTVRLEGPAPAGQTVSGVLPIRQPEPALRALAGLSHRSLRTDGTVFVLTNP